MGEVKTQSSENGFKRPETSEDNNCREHTSP